MVDEADDDPLRREAAELGEMLGETIRVIAGPESFDLVETVRSLARDRSVALDAHWESSTQPWHDVCGHSRGGWAPACLIACPAATR